MSSGLRWIFHLAGVLVGGSGIVLGVMVYLMKPADEWSVVNHPLQPHFLHLHVVVAPIMVFVFGLVWAMHVQTRLSSGSSRAKKTGLALLIPTAVMVMTGYLLQVAVDPGWRSIWAWLHSGVSAGWLALIVAHVVASALSRCRESEVELPGPTSPQVVQATLPGSHLRQSRQK